MLVVRDMVFHGKTSFSELRDMPEGIAKNILADRLVRLEAHDVIRQKRDPNDGRRKHYELTKHGKRLIPILLDLMVWSRHHTSNVDVSKAFAKAIENDRAGAIAEVERRLEERDFGQS